MISQHGAVAQYDARGEGCARHDGAEGDMVQRGQGPLAAEAGDGKADEDFFWQIRLTGTYEFPIAAVGGLETSNRAAISDQFHPIRRLQVRSRIVDYLLALPAFAAEDRAQPAAD